MEDRIKAKIIEAVPEIMELRFGCEVERDGKRYSYCGSGKAPIVFFRENYQGLDLVMPLTYYKILGRPITLADVLRAVGKIHGGSVLMVNSTGGFRHFGGVDGEKEWSDIAMPRWNLTADYDGQTAEVKEFIGELLGV